MGRICDVAGWTTRAPAVTRAGFAIGNREAIDTNEIDRFGSTAWNGTDIGLAVDFIVGRHAAGLVEPAGRTCGSGIVIIPACIFPL